MSITELVSTIHLKDSITFTLNSEFLNHNFDVVRQCLLRVKDLETNMGQSTDNATNLQGRIAKIQSALLRQQQSIRSAEEKVRELSSNVGDDFMKKMYAIEAKTKNMFDFDQTARRLQTLNRFVLVDQFQANHNETKKELQRVWKLREQLDRYLPNNSFDRYKLQQETIIADKERLIIENKEQVQKLAAIIEGIKESVVTVEQNVQQNNNMIKQINFTELLEKLKKFRQDTESKVNQLAAKMKKKVGQNQLLSLENTIIDKLDKFFAQNQRNKAQKTETKQALQFLQKKINDIEDIVIQRSDEDKDALFSSKKWQCASCTKDLGKFQGKMGQYKPWSIFPCKELDPEKTGGFGYLNYIDKMAFKRGIQGEDLSLERLSRTFYDSKEKEPISRKLASTRGSNIINNYGSEERGSSLKETYFKEIQSQRRTSAPRIFRVSKKELVKASQDRKEQQSP